MQPTGFYLVGLTYTQNQFARDAIQPNPLSCWKKDNNLNGNGFRIGEWVDRQFFLPQQVAPCQWVPFALPQVESLLLHPNLCELAGLPILGLHQLESLLHMGWLQGSTLEAHPWSTDNTIQCSNIVDWMKNNTYSITKYLGPQREECLAKTKKESIQTSRFGHAVISFASSLNTSLSAGILPSLIWIASKPPII